MTTGKTIALTRWTFVGKVMSLLLLPWRRTRGSLRSSSCLGMPSDEMVIAAMKLKDTYSLEGKL